MWFVERLTEACGAQNLAGAPWLVYFARALGANIGKGVDLHSMPPITGLLTLGHRSAVEPEVDLSGHWIDGDAFHVGAITIGDDSTIGARTTLLPGAIVGKNADVAPGSGVRDKIKNGQYWKGSPAEKSGRVNHPWPDERPVRRSHWVAVYGLTSLLLGALPLVAVATGLAVIGVAVHHTHRLSQAMLPALAWAPLAALAGFAAYALLTVIAVRTLSFGLREGYHPVRSRTGWQLWTTERLMDAARNYLFPVYASMLTPMWLRLLGAKVGHGTEISTVLLTPKFAVIEDGAFLADDTLVASYELGGCLLYTSIGRGDRIGIRMPSGSYALYVAILSTLATGAAYVPVDADDPDERAELVFGEAGVVAIITEAGLLRGPGSSRGWRAAAPLTRDDAWIIFTSGSTGTPKGVAVDVYKRQGLRCWSPICGTRTTRSGS